MHQFARPQQIPKVELHADGIEVLCSSGLDDRGLYELLTNVDNVVFTAPPFLSLTPEAARLTSLLTSYHTRLQRPRLRVDDELGEYDEQLSSLRQQLALAERYILCGIAEIVDHAGLQHIAIVLFIDKPHHDCMLRIDLSMDEAEVA